MLQADGLEKARQVGMKQSFARVKYIDPHSYVTKEVFLFFASLNVKLEDCKGFQLLIIIFFLFQGPIL